MTTIFAAREIAEAAVEKEIKRRQFYAAVAALSKNPEMKKLFEFLTAEEEKHVARFVEFRDSLPVEARPEEYDGEMQAYMESLVENRLYSGITSKDFVQEAIDTNKVFGLAITLEKDSILFFWEFLQYVSEADQKMVKALIDEEKTHIRMLANMRRELDR